MEKAKLVKADSKTEGKTFDVSSMSMDEILKLQAELNTKKSEIEKAMTAKFETVFSQVTDLLLGQGISLTAKQIEGARSILSPTSGALNAGALVSFSQAFVSAGMGNIQDMLSKMGMGNIPGMGNFPGFSGGVPKGGKMSMNALQSQLQKTMKMAKMQENLKLQKQKKTEEMQPQMTKEEMLKQEERARKAMAELLQDEENHMNSSSKKQKKNKFLT